MRAGKLRMQDTFINWTIDGKALLALNERGHQDGHAGDSKIWPVRLRQVAIWRFPEVIR